MRGIAALAVVALHTCVIFDLPWSFPAAGLAVDFFFCLSGVVIASAYDSRIETMGMRGFWRRRAERLYPMIIVGVLLGGIVAAWKYDGGGAHPALLLAAGCFRGSSAPWRFH